MATKGIERREATPQFISNFEVCENHSRTNCGRMPQVRRTSSIEPKLNRR